MTNPWFRNLPAPQSLAAGGIRSASDKMLAMGGSRRNDNDEKRVAATINNPDVIVSDIEKRRCLDSVEAYHHQLKAWMKDDPSPSVGVACIAGYGWMEVYCGGCRTLTTIDLAGLNVHPLTKVKNVAARLRCTRCRGDGPIAAVRGLRKGPHETLAERARRLAHERLNGTSVNK